MTDGWLDRFKDPLALLFTLALVVVAFLQWMTLEKTDRTARAGQRAFVFVKHETNNWVLAREVGTTVKRSFNLAWENSGNSQTRDLQVSLYCPHPQASNTVDPITAGRDPGFVSPRLLGPKQSVWGGVCEYNADELEDVRDGKAEMFIAAKATYKDVFGESHVTEYCAKIVNLKGDIRKLDAVPTNNLNSCDSHNCADEECAQSAKKKH